MDKQQERWLARIEDHIDKGSGYDDCHLYTGAQDGNGYGIARDWNGKVRRMHILIYEVYSGVPVPDGEVVDHECRIRLCCNFNHLQSKTQKVNTLIGEGPTAKNARKTHCPRGHEYDEENTLWHSGRRECRKCVRAQQKRRRQAARAERDSEP
jgi:hypothetical protein